MDAALVQQLTQGAASSQYQKSNCNGREQTLTMRTFRDDSHEADIVEESIPHIAIDQLSSVFGESYIS